MKIFVTIGTQIPFNRLIRWMQEYICIHKMEVCVQNIDSLLSEERIEEYIKWADVVVAHAGIGTLLKVRSLGKHLIVVPRLAKLNEQRNNHQLDTCSFIREYNLAEVAETKNELFFLLDKWNVNLTCDNFPQKEKGKLSHLTLDLDYKKVLGVCSFGGHAAELNYCIAKSRALLVKVSTAGNCDYLIENFSRANIWKIFKVLVQLWRIIDIESPDIVVSTGAAPGVVAIVIARLRGIKTIWIDSIATRSKISLSGRLVKLFCREFYVQWPNLANRKMKYIGNVLGI